MEGKKKNLAESGNEINTAELLKRLEHPSGRVDVVLDTDTFNEIDDQFALAYLICSKEKLDLQAAFYAFFSFSFVYFRQFPFTGPSTFLHNAP